MEQKSKHIEEKQIVLMKVAFNHTRKTTKDGVMKTT